MFDRVSMKQRVKAMPYTAMTLVAALLSVAATYICNLENFTIDYKDLFSGRIIQKNYSLGILGFILFILVASVLQFGISRFFLIRSRTGAANDINPCFYGFSMGANNYFNLVVTGLLKYIFIALWTLLFVIPGIVKGIAYSFTEYIISDNPSLSPNTAITLSKKITMGHKGELFELILSFFWWYLLTGITAGIAGVYVIPYTHTVYAGAYDHFKQLALDNGVVTSEELYSQPTL